MLQVTAERAANTALKNTLNAYRDETQVWVWGHPQGFAHILLRLVQVAAERGTTEEQVAAFQLSRELVSVDCGAYVEMS